MVPLADFIARHRSLLVITGAGCSAASGIPTYRNERAEWQRGTPIQHAEFLASEQSRRRYWARSFAGWPAVRDATPNGAHTGLAALERKGRIGLLVTQNVDGLHQKAGHRNVVDLHGRLDSVLCVDCGAVSSRAAFQASLQRLNPHLRLERSHLTPDGDAEVDGIDSMKIEIPTCERCNGVIKPNVVFYGGSVDRFLVEKVYTALEDADGVLVAGSSLMVFSAFRFVRRAAGDGKPIAIVNRGITRADDFATIKLDVDCESVLSDLGR